MLLTKKNKYKRAGDRSSRSNLQKSKSRTDEMSAEVGVTMAETTYDLQTTNKSDLIKKKMEEDD